MSSPATASLLSGSALPPPPGLMSPAQKSALVPPPGLGSPPGFLQPRQQPLFSPASNPPTAIPIAPALQSANAIPQSPVVPSNISNPAPLTSNFIAPMPSAPAIIPAEFLNNLSSGSKMKPSDVSFVVKKVLDPMQTIDPFADDYYNIQFKIRKNQEIRDEYISQQLQTPPPLLIIPLPIWKDAKDRICQQIESTKKLTNEKSKQWDEKQQVLGHTSKTDFTRPREVLSVPTLSEMYNSITDNDDTMGDMHVPYSTRLWSMRQAVQRGYEALYTVQELQYLLDTPTIADNSYNRDEVLYEIHNAISALAQSLGIRISQHPSGEVDLETDSNDIVLDGGLVAAILQTTKGKRLLTRSFGLLPPNYRWSLVPVIISRILQTGNEQTADELEIEDSLLKNITKFIRSAYNYHQSLSPAQIDFSYFLLNNLRKCIKSVMITFFDKNLLRNALLSNKSRAEVIHIVIQVGDQITENMDFVARSEWMQIKETFYAMLDT